MRTPDTGATGNVGGKLVERGFKSTDADVRRAMKLIGHEPRT